MSGSRPFGDAGLIAFDRNGVARVPVAMAGRYRVTCDVVRDGAADGSTAPVQEISPAEFVVPIGM